MQEIAGRLQNVIGAPERLGGREVTSMGKITKKVAKKLIKKAAKHAAKKAAKKTAKALRAKV